MNIREILWLLFKTSRSFLMPAMPLFFLLGVVAAGGSVTSFSVLMWLQLFTLTIPVSLLGYGVNDVFDYESDKDRKERQGLLDGVLEKKFHPLILRAAAISGVAIVLVSLLTKDLVNILLAAALVFVSWAYSAPPLRLKSVPFADSLANAFGYFLFPFALGFSHFAVLTEMPVEVFLFSLVMMGVHALASLKDYAADREHGDKTVAVFLGKRLTAIWATLLLLPATVFTYLDNHLDVADFFFSFLVVVFFCFVINPDERKVKKAALLCFVAFVFSVVLFLMGY